MRLSRLAPALVAGALLVASTLPVHAQTEPEVTGVGTTVGDLTLLGLDAGGLVSLDLLTDAGSANIDEAIGPRSAAAQIAALNLDTAVTEPVSVPLLSVTSTGEEEQAGQQVALPANPIVSGSALPLSLAALVDDTGARSSLAAALGDLDVLGGVLSLTGSELDLGSTAAAADSTGTRGIAVDSLTVLDLEALLELLGIPLADLPLDTLLGLLDGLGLLDHLQALLPAGTELSVDGIVAAVDGLLAETDEVLLTVDTVEDLLVDLGDTTGPVCELTDPRATIVGDLLGSGESTGTAVCDTLLADVSGSVESLSAELVALTDLLQDLLDQLQAVLAAPLDLLSGQALLSLQGLDITVLTKATDDVATSVADVTGTLGTLQVGELPVLGALDLTASPEQLDGLLAQAEGLIGEVLAVIDVSLSDLVQIQTMQESTSVEPTDAGGVVSSASFTGLDVQVLPILAELTALLEGLGGDDSVGAVLDGLGLAVPTSGATEVLAVNELLAPVTDGLPLLGALAALEEGLGLRVASLSQQSGFSPVGISSPVSPSTPAAPTLPRTGSDDALLLALAGAAVLAALGGRQLVRRTATDA